MQSRPLGNLVARLHLPCLPLAWRLTSLKATFLYQGSYGHEKSCKVMEFENAFSRPGKVMEFGENDQGHGKVMELQFSVLICRPIFAASKS